MARGYSGAFGRKVNSPWVWIPLSVLFLAPFCSLRRRPGMLQLDLLALVAFGVSVAYFNDANIDASVPIATGCCSTSCSGCCGSAIAGHRRTAWRRPAASRSGSRRCGWRWR